MIESYWYFTSESAKKDDFLSAIVAEGEDQSSENKKAFELPD